MKNNIKNKQNSLKLTTLGFTLIELIAVLVILAILSLIVTPLVMNIIRKARNSADKRSIDAYGHSIELAIASYLLEELKFPASIEDLTIEYSGNKVVCSTTKMNYDSSVYLAGCTVNGRIVEGYTYGREETYTSYKVGDEITYNGEIYYVIKDSSELEKNVKLLKAEPLSVSEVNEYGAGNINRYTFNSPGEAYDNNGYGGMVYYSTETCGAININWVDTGCTNDYEQSDIKKLVDSWALEQAPDALEARLITYDEFIVDIGCKTEACQYLPYDWVFNPNYWYWTMSKVNNTTAVVWIGGTAGISTAGFLGFMANEGVVRPVIVLPKSVL